MIQSSRRRRRLPENDHTSNQQSIEDGIGDRSTKGKRHDRRTRAHVHASQFFLGNLWRIGSGRNKRKTPRKLHQPAKTFLLFLIAICFLLWMFSHILLGDGSDPEGGLLGQLFDRLVTEFQYPTAKLKELSYGTTKYPFVDQRNSRDKIRGSSEYLSVILNSNKDNQRESKERHDILKADSIAGQRHPQSPAKSVDFSNLSTVLEILRINGCKPSWTCFRCLALFGQTEQSCRSTCPACLFTALCESMQMPNIQLKQDLLNTASSDSKLQLEAKHPVPRIIHQIGKEEWLDPSLFPNFVRIQNSWRLQNAAYVYHTQESLRAFVKKEFSTLCELFEELEEADKLSLAGLLVLYEKGGVLAKANLLLEVDLDKILDSGVSFVASSIGSKNINKGCLYLWNGFIAAEKKNPVIGLAIALKVEALKAPTRNSPWIPRLWDVSRTQCGQHETLLPTCWSGIQAESKHLSESEMFDSFVLGHAFEAMAYDTFNEIKLHGDRIFTSGNQMTNAFAMILLMSFNDAGATRLTEVENNVLIGSTDLLGSSIEWKALRS